MHDENLEFKNALQKLWEECDASSMLLCHMKDGNWAVLLSGPSRGDKGEDAWKYGFEVRGQPGVKWLNYNELQIIHGISGKFLRQIGGGDSE